MRDFVRARWRRWGCAGIAGSFGAIGMGPAAQAAGSIFPTDQAFVPLAVGAAFALPAIVAGSLALVLRVGRRIGATGSAVVVLTAAVAVTGYLQPELLHVLRP